LILGNISHNVEKVTFNTPSLHHARLIVWSVFQIPEKSDTSYRVKQEWNFTGSCSGWHDFLLKSDYDKLA